MWGGLCGNDWVFDSWIVNIGGNMWLLCAEIRDGVGIEL